MIFNIIDTTLYRQTLLQAIVQYFRSFWNEHNQLMKIVIHSTVTHNKFIRLIIHQLTKQYFI